VHLVDVPGAINLHTRAEVGPARGGAPGRVIPASFCGLRRAVTLADQSKSLAVSGATVEAPWASLKLLGRVKGICR
jgi:hypothetical protein